MCWREHPQERVVVEVGVTEASFPQVGKMGLGAARRGRVGVRGEARRERPEIEVQGDRAGCRANGDVTAEVCSAV